MDKELERTLTLLRNKIRERGYTQLGVQESLGWGRSYISQLLTRQKSLRMEQILLILDAIDVAPADFFRELYQISGTVDHTSDQQELLDTFRDARNMLRALIQLMTAKDLINTEELTTIMDELPDE
ncbi:MAG: helix-turn-helix transcriptional regulator [Acidobacteriota bacterium]